MMRNAVANTLQAIGDLLAPLNLTPAQWLLAALALLFGVLLLALLLRRRAPRESRVPQLLISRGEINQAENSSLQLLSLKVSNLNDYPVQLLELALKTELMPHPLPIEAVELLPPHQAIELEAELPSDIVGDQGLIYAYLHLPGPKRAVFRLQGHFSWEPWNKRYKVSPLKQTLRPARELSSSQYDALRKRAWLERNPHLTSGPRPGATVEGREVLSDEQEEQQKPKPVWEFPNEF